MALTNNSDEVKELTKEDIRKQLYAQLGGKNQLDKFTNLKEKFGDSKAFAEEMKQIIHEANLGQLPDLEKNTKTSLSELVKGLTLAYDSMGDAVDRFQTFNSEEQEVINAANQRVSDAEQKIANEEKRVEQYRLELASAEALTNYWVDINGRRSKIRNANESIQNSVSNIARLKAELEDAKSGIPLADQKAISMRDTRIDNADISSNISVVTDYSEVIIDVFDEKIKDNAVTIKNLSTDRVKLQAEFEASEKELKVVRKEIAGLEKKLEVAQEELNGLSAEDASTMKGEIGKIEIEIEEKRAQERDLISIHDSSETFTTIFLGQIKSLQVTTAVMKSLQILLKKKTESRIKSSKATIKQLQDMKALRLGSNIEQAGNAIDEKNYKITAQIMEMARKDFKQRLNAQPEAMKKYTAILQEIAKIANAFKKDVDEYQEAVEKGFAESKKNAEEDDKSGENGVLDHDLN